MKMAHIPPVLPRYIPLDGYRFDWTEAAVIKFITLYEEGRNNGLEGLDILPWLALKCQCHKTEALILFMDLAEKDYITATGRGEKVFSLQNEREA